MVDFLKISQYFAMLDALLHIGNQAVAAVAAAEPDSAALQKIEVHLNAFTAVVDNLESPVEGVIKALNPPKV